MLNLKKKLILKTYIIKNLIKNNFFQIFFKYSLCFFNSSSVGLIIFLKIINSLNYFLIFLISLFLKFKVGSF